MSTRRNFIKATVLAASLSAKAGPAPQNGRAVIIGNAGTVGVQRFQLAGGQVADFQVRAQGGRRRNDTALPTTVNQCEHDQAGLRLSYPCRPSTTP